MSLTVIQKLNIGALSEAYSSIDIKKSGVNAGGIDYQLPRKIYCIRKSIQWLSDLDNTDSTLDTTTNYLLSLCGKYYLQAQIAITSGGGVVVPATSSQFPIVVDGSNFQADGITYNNPSIVGINLMIFISGYNQEWHFAPTDFIYTAAGIQIIIPGFNANNYSSIIIQNYVSN